MKSTIRMKPGVVSNDSSHHTAAGTEALVKDKEIELDAFLDNHRFLELLRLEKHRAQRSGSALSILMIKLFNPKRQSGASIIREISKLIKTKLRETDIVGFIDQRTLGVILPYTDTKGAHRSAEKIRSCFINPQFSISVSTYPDAIFESLTKNGCVSPEVIELILEGQTEHSWLSLKIKRLIDILGSIFALIVLSPLMLGTAILIKRGSPGPVIFKQIRLGEKGKPFKFYKFRSMYVNSDEQIHKDYVAKLISGEDASINQGDSANPLFKMTADPRITPIGKIIRKTSIDELPQFYNVLKGDMSLVGPRPPLAYEAEEYRTWHLRRILEMKPGITGLWQVEGRSRTEFDDAVRLDVRYLQTWSIWLDLKILIKTVKEVLQCRGAY